MAIHRKVKYGTAISAVVAAVVAVAAAEGFTIPVAVSSAVIVLANFIAAYLTPSEPAA